MKLKIDEIKINSLIIAICLCSTMIATTLLLGFGMQQNGNLYILIVLAFLFGIKMLLGFNPFTLLTKKVTFIMLGLVTLLYLFSVILVGDKMEYSLIQFIFYAILPIICISLPASGKYVCKYAMIISLFTVFAGNKWFDFIYAFMNQAEMGYIYPIVTVLTCTFFHFRYYRKERDTGLLCWVAYAYNTYLLVRTFMVANRGAWMAIIFTLFVVILYDFNDEGLREKRAFKLFIIWVVVLGAIMIFFTSMSEVLAIMANVSTALFDDVPSFILKMQHYIELGDLSNGREPIYNMLYKAIAESPVWGHGLETFNSYTNGMMKFPHNFILQYLFEGGILFATIPIYFAIKLPIMVISGRIYEKDQYVLAAMLVCQCYPKLLLSSDVWLGTAAWMMITYSAAFKETSVMRETVKIDTDSSQ